MILCKDVLVVSLDNILRKRSNLALVALNQLVIFLAVYLRAFFQGQIDLGKHVGQKSILGNVNKAAYRSAANRSRSSVKSEI